MNPAMHSPPIPYSQGGPPMSSLLHSSGIERDAEKEHGVWMFLVSTHPPIILAVASSVLVFNSAS